MMFKAGKTMMMMKHALVKFLLIIQKNFNALKNPRESSTRDF